LLDALKNPRVEVVLVVLSKGHPERLAFLQSKDLTTQLPPVVVLTDCFDVDLYVEALRRGAYDGVGIPLDHKELLRVIRAAVTEERSRRRELAATA
jgi:FixJ family two-component response regulator